mgnify:CR=1 FL=1
MAESKSNEKLTGNLGYEEHFRRSQIPLTKDRLKYLTEEYSPKEGDEYVMEHQPGKFLVTNSKTNICQFEAQYETLEDNSNLGGVVTGFLARGSFEDEFSFFSDLILNVL